MTSYSRQIADFAAGLRFADIPEDVIARSKAIMLDGLGCALYAADLPWTRILAKVVGRLEPHGGQATIWGRGASASGGNAVLLNGTMVQGYELDDTHSTDSFHSCAAVLSPAFAMAEHVGTENVSGESLLLAIIAGTELGPRISRCISGARMIINGWHAPGMVSSFPAAITSGKILGLSGDQFFHALGIAGTQACGLMASQFGAMVKRMQCAINAQGGFYAALLAADGFTGIEDIFEQKYGGYCSTFTHSTDQFDLDALVDGLGQRFEIMRIGIKIYACAGGPQPAVNAVEELMRNDGLKAQDVEAITIYGTQERVSHHGWWPYVPKGLTGAQMHNGFCVAMQLIEGEVFVEQMIEENAGRADLVELANRVRVVRSVEREKRGKEYSRGYDLEVKLKNGKILTQTVDFRPGSERRPLTLEQITHKFRRLASKTLSPSQVAALEKIVLDIDHAPTVTPLLDALRGSKR